MRVEPAAGVHQVQAVVDGVDVERLNERPRLAVDVRALDDEAQCLAGAEPGPRGKDLDVEGDDLTASGLAFPLVREDRLARG